MEKENTTINRRDGLYGFEFREADLRRAESGERKSYNIKQLWQRTHEMVNLHVQGFSNIEIAEILNVEPETVSYNLNGDLAKAKIAELRFGRDADVRKTAEKIRVLTDKALQTYHEIFDNDNGEATLKDRKDVADTVLLELSGLRVPTKTQSQVISTVLSREELESFKNRGKKAAEDMGIIIDQPNQDDLDRTEPASSETSESKGE